MSGGGRWRIPSCPHYHCLYWAEDKHVIITSTFQPWSASAANFNISHSLSDAAAAKQARRVHVAGKEPNFEWLLPPQVQIQRHNTRPFGCSAYAVVLWKPECEQEARCQVPEDAREHDRFKPRPEFNIHCLCRTVTVTLLLILQQVPVHVFITSLMSLQSDYFTHSVSVQGGNYSDSSFKYQHYCYCLLYHIVLNVVYIRTRGHLWYYSSKQDSRMEASLKK